MTDNCSRNGSQLKVSDRSKSSLLWCETSRPPKSIDFSDGRGGDVSFRAFAVCVRRSRLRNKTTTAFVLVAVRQR